MANRLREAIGRLWGSLWRPRDPDDVPSEPEPEGRVGVKSRARFWAEFREGQREAEAHAASRPR